MANKKAKTKKPKQQKQQNNSEHKGGSSDFGDIGSPQPKGKQKKQK